MNQFVTDSRVADRCFHTLSVHSRVLWLLQRAKNLEFLVPCLWPDSPFFKFVDIRVEKLRKTKYATYIHAAKTAARLVASFWKNKNLQRDIWGAVNINSHVCTF